MLRQEESLRRQSDQVLRKQSLSLIYRARSGESLDHLAVEAYPLIREAVHRQLGIRHFSVQLLGGVTLENGCIAEMQTGEGKTLTAALPLYLNALAGHGAHLATANDYLADRDANHLRPVYEMLGLTVGVVQSQMTRSARRDAYACDITYGTAKEFGFDFLKDRLLERRLGDGNHDGVGSLLGGTTGRGSPDQPLQRRLWFALVDEADSILIDDARTPLILSAVPSRNLKAAEAAFSWAAKVAEQFEEDSHFQVTPEQLHPRLTVEGRRLVRGLSKPPSMQPLGQVEVYEYIERAILVRREYHLNRQFVVKDGEVVIIDESTGRLAEGRKWRDGVHQAVEAKQGLPISLKTTNAAQITVQQFFRLYHRLAGMTGTALSAAREFHSVYSCPVVPIPTNRPCLRTEEPARVYASAEEKWAAVAEETVRIQAGGRPVLIGTKSIEQSEFLANELSVRGVEYSLLHAKHLAAEAEIIAEAGQAGRVTVATNMAGRGTDIVLGEGVAQRGGLHVILTELHDSARIDRQLIGRCARQGDPGSFTRMISWEDDILKAAFGQGKAGQIRLENQQANMSSRTAVRLFEQAQRFVERKQAQGRRRLLQYVKRRTELQKRMGLSPYLDTPS